MLREIILDTIGINLDNIPLVFLVPERGKYRLTYSPVILVLYRKHSHRAIELPASLDNAQFFPSGIILNLTSHHLETNQDTLWLLRKWAMPHTLIMMALKSPKSGKLLRERMPTWLIS